MLFVVLFLCFLTSTKQQEQEWRFFEGYEYYIDPTALAFEGNDAFRICSSYNALIVTLKTPRVRAFMSRVFMKTNITEPPYCFYLGISRHKSRTKVFKWVDRSYLEHSLAHWAEGEPSNDSSNIVVVAGNETVREEELYWRAVNKQVARAACYRKSKYIPTALPDTTAEFLDTTEFEALLDIEVQAADTSTFAETTPTATEVIIEEKQEEEDSGILMLILIIVGSVLFLLLVLLALFLIRRRKMANSLKVVVNGATLEDDDEEDEDEESDEEEGEVKSSEITLGNFLMKLSRRQLPGTRSPSWSEFLEASSTLSMVSNLVRRMSSYRSAAQSPSQFQTETLNPAEHLEGWKEDPDVEAALPSEDAEIDIAKELADLGHGSDE